MGQLHKEFAGFSRKSDGCAGNADYSTSNGPIPKSHGKRFACVNCRRANNHFGKLTTRTVIKAQYHGLIDTRSDPRPFQGELGMNHSLPTSGRLALALLVTSLLSAQAVNAQPQGYQAPSFSGMANAKFHQAQQIPAFPASPLAGGPAAAQGNEFVDVQGNPIIMQTQYGAQVPPGFAGGGGGYGDPMAVDFGGYGQEQVGPHYFDISLDTVFLQANELLDGVGPITSVGIGGPQVLDPADSGDDYEAGWQIAARYDLGALSVFEVTYMGLYDFGFTNSINSEEATLAFNGVAQDFQLESLYSDFGGNVAVFPVQGFDDARQHTVSYESELQSTELSYRRYWVGNNPRVSGTLLMGARYLRMTEDFNFNSIGLVNGLATPASRLYSSENDMVGFQFGGDGWLGLRQGLRLGGEAKAGVYNNSFKFRHAATLPGDPDFDVITKGDQVAFAAEGGATMVADILPSLSLRGGYRVLYLNSIASVGASITNSVNSTVVGNQAHALYHGFHGGIEYVW